MVPVVFGVSLVFMAGGDVVAWAITGPEGEVPFPSWPDVGYVIGAGLSVAALLLLGWQAREFFRTAIFDTLLATGGLTVMAVQVGIWPALTADGAPVEKSVATFYALVDFVFVSVSGWILLARRQVPRGAVLLVGSALIWFTGDVWFEVVELGGGQWPDGSWQDLLWYVPNAMQALAVRAGVGVIPGRGEPGLSSRRLLIAGTVGMLGPAGLVLLPLVGVEVSAAVVGISALVPLAAALARMYVLLRRLEGQALRDTLTGLINRRAFVDHAQHLIAQGRLAGVLLIDLDGFKAVNDTFGHAAGNDVLVATAHRLRETVPPGCRVARLGGDEFAVLVPLGARVDVAALEAAVRRAVPHEGQLLDGVGASIGWAGAAASATDRLEDLLAMADADMYRVKRARKGAERVPEPRDPRASAALPQVTPPG